MYSINLFDTEVAFNNMNYQVTFDSYIDDFALIYKIQSTYNKTGIIFPCKQI